MIAIYLLSSGVFLYKDIGVIETLIADLSNDKDFTLSPPPNYDQPWYWYNAAWQSEPKQTP